MSHDLKLFLMIYIPLQFTTLVGSLATIACFRAERRARERMKEDRR